MLKKVAIALAPTGGWGVGSNNPLSPEALAAEVSACAALGVSVLHLHCRDEGGMLTDDLRLFDTSVGKVKAKCDVILEASTGGLSELSCQQRIVPVRSRWTEMGSLNIGSLNFGDQVYQNSLPDIRFWASEMARCGVKPSLEIFDTGHLETAHYLLEEQIVEHPPNVSFIFNVKWGMRYSRALLNYLLANLPKKSHWGAVFVGSTDFSHHIEVVQLGASVIRVGFEDSTDCNGKRASSNRELVATLLQELEKIKVTPMSVSEARKSLLS